MKRLLVTAAVVAASVLAVPPAAAQPTANPNIERWHDVAISVGWTEAQWPWMVCTMQQESGGLEWVHNGRDPGYGSFGLMQVNMSKGKSGTWNLYAPILSWDINHMFTPEVNFAVALDLKNRAKRMGLAPWGRDCGWRYLP